jgi:hypothetical protein
MKIDPSAMLRGVQALLATASQEDRKTGEVLEQQGFERYLASKEAELEAKATQANCDYHVKNVEGAWGMIPVVGSGIGTMMTMGKDGREEYLRRIPGIGDWVADNETSLLVGALFVNAATAVPAAAILATDAGGARGLTSHRDGGGGSRAGSRGRRRGLEEDRRRLRGSQEARRR